MSLQGPVPTARCLKNVQTTRYRLGPGPDQIDADIFRQGCLQIRRHLFDLTLNVDGIAPVRAVDADRDRWVFTDEIGAVAVDAADRNRAMSPIVSFDPSSFERSTMASI